MGNPAPVTPVPTIADALSGFKYASASLSSADNTLVTAANAEAELKAEYAAAQAATVQATNNDAEAIAAYNQAIDVVVAAFQSSKR